MAEEESNFIFILTDVLCFSCVRFHYHLSIFNKQNLTCAFSSGLFYLLAEVGMTQTKFILKLIPLQTMQTLPLKPHLRLHFQLPIMRQKRRFLHQIKHQNFHLLHQMLQKLPMKLRQIKLIQPMTPFSKLQIQPLIWLQI